MKLNENHGPLNQHYLKRFDDVVKDMLECVPRVMAFRVDLRLPDGVTDIDKDSAVITRFFSSLKAQLRAHRLRTKKQGKRTYPDELRYLWVREFGEEKGKKHYHVLILVNKDAYCWVGNIFADLKSKPGTMCLMVMKAWLRALRLQDPAYRSSIYIPSTYYHLHKKDGLESIRYREMLYHISYMAKLATKHNEDGERNFGCSQKLKKDK